MKKGHSSPSPIPKTAKTVVDTYMWSDILLRRIAAQYSTVERGAPMKIEIEKKIDSGAYGNVYRAKTELDTWVAVKIIRKSAEEESNALDHAKALARAEHKNVVRVLSIEQVQDPETGEITPGIVMELLDAPTLGKRLTGKKFSREESKTIGESILDGLAHIHSQGLVHSDLHTENVLVSESYVKIIDILYKKSLAILTTESREAKITRDIRDAKMLLYDILRHSQVDLNEVSKFGSATKELNTITELREAFTKTLEATKTTNIDTIVTNVLLRYKEPIFSDSESYATALNDETTTEAIKPLLAQIIETSVTRNEHSQFLIKIWKRISKNDQDDILNTISGHLDRETPNGNWHPHMIMLRALGIEAWKRLRAVSRLRLEELISHDILQGREDFFAAFRMWMTPGGVLGSWATVFGPVFENRDKLVDNITTMLNRDWYTQNYIAKHFFHSLQAIADKTNNRKKLINGLIQSVRNDAILVKANLNQLPEDWRAEIREAIEE